MFLKFSIFLWVHGRDVACRHHYMTYWFYGLASFQALAQKEDSFWAWISLLTNKCLDHIQVQIRGLHIFFFLFLCLYSYFIEPRDPCIIFQNLFVMTKKNILLLLGGLVVKNLLTKLETQLQSLGQEDPSEKRIATHSSILTWRIQWTREPGELSPWDHRVRYNLVNYVCMYVSY